MATELIDLQIDGFERVVKVANEAAGLLGYIAVHNTKFGPGLGGIRYKEYNTELQALNDVTSLAQAMTNKNALANLSFGGAKGVIIKVPTSTPRRDTYRAMGEAVEQLGGSYICCEDVGTVTQDLFDILQTTRYCSGTKMDSGIATAKGLFHVFKAYCMWEEMELSDITVTVAGLGKVGSVLANLLFEEGTTLNLTDIDFRLLTNFWQAHGPEKNSRLDHISAHEVGCEVYSPCALGGILNRTTRKELNCNAVIGSANNQLDSHETGRYLHKRGILYLPDYLVNAGGVIAVATEIQDEIDNLDLYLGKIGERARHVVRESEATGFMPLVVTEEMVRERLSA
jgi:glutamate dehydrogenase/leucine dehydrogenase